MSLQRWRGGQRPDMKKAHAIAVPNRPQQYQQPTHAPPMNVPRLPPIQITEQMTIVAPTPPAAASAAQHIARPPPPPVQAPFDATNTRNASQQNDIPIVATQSPAMNQVRQTQADDAAKLGDLGQFW